MKFNEFEIEVCFRYLIGLNLILVVVGFEKNLPFHYEFRFFFVNSLLSRILTVELISICIDNQLNALFEKKPALSRFILFVHNSF